MINILELLFPGKSRLKREISEAKAEIEPISDNLVDWEGDELELMSLIQEERKVKSAFESSVTGIICSIYHEHMVSYQWKKLFGIGVDTEIMVANTKKYHYEYVTKGNKTSFYVNDKFLGEFRKDNALYISRKRILGYIEEKASSEWWNIYFDRSLVGSVVNIHKAREVNPRAFQLQRGINSDQEMVFLAIAIFKIVDITRRMKKYPFR